MDKELTIGDGAETNNWVVLLVCAQFYDWVLLGQRLGVLPNLGRLEKVPWKR